MRIIDKTEENKDSYKEIHLSKLWTIKFYFEFIKKEIRKKKATK